MPCNKMPKILIISSSLYETLCDHSLRPALLFANGHDVFAKLLRNDWPFFAVGKPLCACSWPSWRRFVAWISVVARRFELRIRMVRPYICRLHSLVTILAICHRVTWQAVHEVHLPQPAPWVFNKPVFGRKRKNKAKNVLIDFITKLRIIRNRRKVAISLSLSLWWLIAAIE